MEGVPADDLQRHREALPPVPYKRIKVSEGGLLPLLAAQKASVPDASDVPTPVYSTAAPPYLGPMASSSVQSLRPPMVGGGLGSIHVASFVPPLSPTAYSPYMAMSVSTFATPIASLPLSPGIADRPDSLAFPPTVDAATGRTIPGGIILAPDLQVSMVSKATTGVIIV